MQIALDLFGGQLWGGTLLLTIGIIACEKQWDYMAPWRGGRGRVVIEPTGTSEGG